MLNCILPMSELDVNNWDGYDQKFIYITEWKWILIELGILFPRTNLPNVACLKILSQTNLYLTLFLFTSSRMLSCDHHSNCLYYQPPVYLTLWKLLLFHAVHIIIYNNNETTCYNIKFRLEIFTNMYCTFWLK